MIQALYCVIVNWNLKEDTRDCIESLLAAGVPPGQVIVVDNGSTDGSPQALRERFGSAIQLVESGQNLGFAAGNNLGIHQALDQGAGWILLINNDTTVAPDFLSEMERAVESHNEFQIFGPLILYHHDPERIWFLGDRLIPGILATRSLHRGQKERPPYPAILPVDFITGCAMLVKRDVFREAGLLDTSLFMYGEDVDFCWRARSAGFRLAAVPAARMWHKVSTSADREKSKNRYHRIRNQIRFYRVYSRGWQIPLMFIFSTLRTFRLTLEDLLKGQAALIPPLWQAWTDGWFNLHRPVRERYGTNQL